jgi:hypothetical protein
MSETFWESEVMEEDQFGQQTQYDPLVKFESRVPYDPQPRFEPLAQPEQQPQFESQAELSTATEPEQHAQFTEESEETDAYESQAGFEPHAEVEPELEAEHAAEPEEEPAQTHAYEPQVQPLYPPKLELVQQPIALQAPPPLTPPPPPLAQQPEPQAEPAVLSLSAIDFSGLEERILRTVNLVKRERQASVVAEDRAARAEAHIEEQAHHIAHLQSEIQNLYAERDHVRQRVERLLVQLDALEL